MTAIIYKIGDLLNAEQKVIVHGCNAHGVMGSGVARQIRAKWSNVFEVYALNYKTFGLELGDIIPVATIDGHIVVNAITQDNFGRNGERFVDYNAVETCMNKINKRAIDWEVKEIAVPFIGAGLGGGDWSIIEQIIIKSATNYTPIVYSIDGLLPDGSSIRSKTYP